ncbi:MAG TPA: hypothetical protein DCQ13_03970 [Firmicutes bacterium]|nr:hypothetical protein [Bacillota bacterium]
MDEFTRHLDKEFLDAIERTVTEACEEMRKSPRGNSTRADWHLRAKAAWDTAIENAAGGVLGRASGSTEGWDGSASEPIADSRHQKLNRFER